MSTSGNTYFTYATPHGPITIGASDRGVTEVAFSQVALSGRNVASALTNQAANEFAEYLAGKRHAFDVRLDVQGSAFQKAVWECVCEIPYGEVRTAADIAAAIGKAGSHRSVGTAVKMCKLAPFVPAHRVTSGQLPKIYRAFQALEARG